MDLVLPLLLVEMELLTLVSQLELSESVNVDASLDPDPELKVPEASLAVSKLARVRLAHHDDADDHAHDRQRNLIHAAKAHS